MLEINNRAKLLNEKVESLEKQLEEAIDDKENAEEQLEHI